jgi:hypothetical protein
MADTDDHLPGTATSTADIMWDRRANGDLIADIGHDLGFTPLEVLDILRAERRRRGAGGDQATPAGSAAGSALGRAESVTADARGSAGP